MIKFTTTTTANLDANNNVEAWSVEITAQDPEDSSVSTSQTETVLVSESKPESEWTDAELMMLITQYVADNDIANGMLADLGRSNDATEWEF